MVHILQVLRENVFLFAVLGGEAALLGLVFTIYKAIVDKHVRILKDRIHGLEQELKDAKEAGDPGDLRDQNRQFLEDNANLQNLLGAADAERNALQCQYDELEAAVASVTATLQAEREASQQIVDGLTGELEGLQEDLARKDRVERRRERLIKNALKLEGKIYLRKVLRGAPPFRPLSERHSPIISVVNLKGGVGKTTITANLAMSLSARGYRVLMVDLDLQGSLSSLFVNETILDQRARDGLLLQHFLTKVAAQAKANLLDYCVPVFDGNQATMDHGDGNCTPPDAQSDLGSVKILPATDSLGYTESSLTMQWLLGYGKRDIRFLLRRGLHHKKVVKEFDIVLLDCPPVLNACCLNALTASDYVLIPTVPSRSAAVRVPLFLRRLELLKPIINPSLKVLGSLLNRTHSSELIHWERDLWNITLAQCQNVWKEPIYDFQTSVRQTTEVRDLENEFVRPEPDSELHGVFSRIVIELEKRLPNDCQRIRSHLV